MSYLKLPNLPRLPLYILPLILAFSSCSESEEEEPLIEEVGEFERHPLFTIQRTNMGLLEVIGNRMYISNERGAGYFIAGGEEEFFFNRPYDMAFGHAFSENFTIGVQIPENGIMINSNYNITDVALAGVYTIPNLTSDAFLKPTGLEIPTFGINGSYILSSWKENVYDPENETVFIIELNTNESPLFPGQVTVDIFDPVKRKISLDFEVDGRGFQELYNVFSYKDGWVATGAIAGYFTSFYISKEGEVSFAKGEITERVEFYSLVNGPSGSLYATSQDGLLYSSTGELEDLKLIANSSQLLRIQFLGDRMVAWIGRDRLFEIVNFSDSESIEIKELENIGIEGLWVKDVEFFDSVYYVATNGGLFTKQEADFWAEKESDQILNGEQGWFRSVLSN